LIRLLTASGVTVLSFGTSRERVTVIELEPHASVGSVSGRPANGVVLDDDPERSVALAPCGHIDFRSGKA
jgi:hypothetical protein